MNLRDGEFSGAAAASTSASHLHDPATVDSDDDRPPLPFPHSNNFPDHHDHFPFTQDDALHRRFGAIQNDGAQAVRNDACSGIITVITFWSFVSMTMIFGIYGSEIIKLGPNASILIKPNPLFVEYVKVERLDGAINEPMLYGFDGSPLLDVVSNWSEHRKTTLPGGTHKEWLYFLNMGSQADVVYNVTSLGPSSLVLVIAEGNQGLARWLEDPSYPNITLLWKLIRGTGVITQYLVKSASYYIAVGNLNSDTVEVDLHFRIRALLYNTSNAYYKCNVALDPCRLKISFTGGNSALLTSSGHKVGVRSGKTNVRLSYGPRWITYLGGIGGVMVIMSLAVRFFNTIRHTTQQESSSQGNMGSQSAPLIPRKDDDLSSLGSSYDSVSQDDEDPVDGPSVGSPNGNPASDLECDNNSRRLCAICFDAPRDCFFLPCGHCVSCYACGTKIAEVAGTCPICRRHMKKVRKIYSV